MSTTTNQKSVKMVPVDGVWIRADKAEGRRQAKRVGYAITDKLVDDIEKRREALKADKEKKYTDVEITNIIRSEKDEEDSAFMGITLNIDLFLFLKQYG